MFETLRLAVRGTPVAKETVVTHWLATELEKHSHTELEARLDDVPGDVAAGLTTQVFEGENADWQTRLSCAEKEAVLDALTHGPVQIFWMHEPLNWYRISVPEDAFRRLRAMPWPDWIGWGRASQPDDTIARAVQAFLASDPDDDQLTGDFKYVDLDYIHTLTMADEWPIKRPLIGVQHKSGMPPAVLDGNHRTAAAYLQLLRGEIYHPIEMYVGVRAADWELFLQRWIHRLRTTALRN